MSLLLLFLLQRRLFFVPEPVLVKVTNTPSKQVVDLNWHPTDAAFGTREVQISNEFFLPSQELLKLKVGEIFRLKDLYNIEITEIKADGSYICKYAGEELIPGSLKLQWVPADEFVKVHVTIPHLLLKDKKINPNSLETCEGYAEISLKTIKLNEILQFERWAFIKHEKAATKHGPGIITKIKKKCGHVNVRKVLVKIDDAEKKRKTLLSRDKKEAIILSYALPVKEKPDKESRTAIEAKLYKAETVTQENNKIKSEQSEQIIKLKATVKKLKVEKAELIVIIEEYKAKEKKFMDIWNPVSNFIEQEMHAEAVIV